MKIAKADQLDITVTICLTVLVIVLIACLADCAATREREITNRILGTNGVEFKRSE